MKLAIIVDDLAIYVDSLSYKNLLLPNNIPSNVHALQWDGETNTGWIEYKINEHGNKPENESITSLPQWANDCVNVWQQADYLHNNPPHIPATAEKNSDLATFYLSQTDWSVLPDVSDPSKSNPYLGNVADFINYRNKIRQFIVAPVAGDVILPEKPKAQWITT